MALTTKSKHVFQFNYRKKFPSRLDYQRFWEECVADLMACHLQYIIGLEVNLLIKNLLPHKLHSEHLKPEEATNRIGD